MQREVLAEPVRLESGTYVDDYANVRVWYIPRKAVGPE